jgi:hypothetical protein
MLKKTLTAVAVDHVRDYLRERLEKLKELDLDQDGQKDVDQVVELLTHVGEKMRVAIEATDFQKLATGLEQVVSGASLIGSSVDKETLGAAVSESMIGMHKIGKLLQLGIAEVKRMEKQS